MCGASAESLRVSELFPLYSGCLSDRQNHRRYLLPKEPAVGALQKNDVACSKGPSNIETRLSNLSKLYQNILIHIPMTLLRTFFLNKISCVLLLSLELLCLKRCILTSFTTSRICAPYMNVAECNSTSCYSHQWTSDRSRRRHWKILKDVPTGLRESFNVRLHVRL